MREAAKDQGVELRADVEHGGHPIDLGNRGETPAQIVIGREDTADQLADLERGGEEPALALGQALLEDPLGEDRRKPFDKGQVEDEGNEFVGQVRFLGGGWPFVWLLGGASLPLLSPLEREASGGALAYCSRIRSRSGSGPCAEFP